MYAPRGFSRPSTPGRGIRRAICPGLEMQGWEITFKGEWVKTFKRGFATVVAIILWPVNKLLQDRGYQIRTHYVKSVQRRSFFWSVFSCIQTEYGDLLCKSPYSVQIQENTDQKNLRIWTLFTQWLCDWMHDTILKD